MTYIISGICGSLEKYNTLKENAFIKDTDTVYILGGVCGGDLSLLAELSMCANVYPIMSKSDYDSFRMLRGFEKALQSTGDPDPKFIAEMKVEVMRIAKLKIAGLLNDKDLDEYPLGALVAIEDLLAKKERALNFSSNAVMTADSVLLGILEEKYKWQKL